MIILRNNERLMAEIDRIAEVAGYLWTKGWAEPDYFIERGGEGVAGFGFLDPLARGDDGLMWARLLCDGYRKTDALRGERSFRQRLFDPYRRRWEIV